MNKQQLIKLIERSPDDMEFSAWFGPEIESGSGKYVGDPDINFYTGAKILEIKGKSKPLSLDTQ